MALIRSAIIALLALLSAVAQDPKDASVKDRPAAPQPAPVAGREALIARAKSFELNTPYVPPPGDPLVHHTSGYAKIMCAAVFITGLDPDFAAENVGYFTGPYADRSKVGKPVVDRDAKLVRITIPGGATITSRYFGRQGCVALPPGESALHFKPVPVRSALPDPATQAWPMGDVLPKEPLPAGLDRVRLAQAVDAA